MKKNKLILVLITLTIVIIGVGSVLNVKKYTTKGYATKVGFPKLSFNYFSSWKVVEDASLEHNFDKIKITKNNFIISIDQLLLVGGGDCRFNDSPNLPGDNTDLRMVTYKEMDSSIGYLRYFRFPSENGTPTNYYGFCMKDQKRSTTGKNVYRPPDAAYVSLDVPDTQNILIFQEALNIIKNIRKVE